MNEHDSFCAWLPILMRYRCQLSQLIQNQSVRKSQKCEQHLFKFAPEKNDLNNNRLTTSDNDMYTIIPCIWVFTIHCIYIVQELSYRKHIARQLHKH